MSGITDPTEEFFKDGLWGWDGTQWRKLGLALWFHATYSEDLSCTASSSTPSVWSSAVPAGYIYVVSSASIRNTTRAVERAEIRVYSDTDVATFVSYLISLAQYQPIFFTGTLILPTGWRILMTMSGCSVGDVIQAGVAGYKVKIT